MRLTLCLSAFLLVVPSHAALVAHYQFNEGTGSISSDLSGNGNTGTVVGASWSGGALDFDGVDDHVSIPNSPTINLTGNTMTVMAWVKWEINPTSGASWASIVNKNGDGQFRLHHNSNNSRFEFAVSTAGGGGWVFSSTAPVINQWYHVAGTYDGAAIRIYVDGQLEGSLAMTGNIIGSTSPVNIGNRAISNDRFFAGMIDDVRLYNHTLSQTDISAAMIPEPTSVLMLLSATGLILRRRRA